MLWIEPCIVNMADFVREPLEAPVPRIIALLVGRSVFPMMWLDFELFWPSQSWFGEIVYRHCASAMLLRVVDRLGNLQLISSPVLLPNCINDTMRMIDRHHRVTEYAIS